MKTVVNVIVDNDGYLIERPGQDGEYVKIMPQGIQRIPCIPFYQSAWFVKGKDVIPAIQDFANAANLLYGGISKANALVASPADALPADQIMLTQTFEVAGLKKIKLISKTRLVEAMGYTTYIAVSVSERLLILEWYRDGVVAEAKYYNKAAVSRKKLYGDIQSFKQRNEEKINIFIFDGCNELSGLADMGHIIDAKKMTQLLHAMSEVYFGKKKLEDVMIKEDIPFMTEDEDEEENEESEVMEEDVVEEDEQETEE